jgi:N-acetylmuramoyl-L-alanine amidase
LVNPLPPGSFTPSSLTGKIKVFNDSIFDVVQIQLFSKLAYQSFHLTDPSKIVVDIFGATSNTNWIDQLSNLKEVKKVTYEQIADDIFRVYISLNHQQHWGHQIYYSGNNLIVKIKPQPKSLLLKDFTIAIDAGHGGTNTGAVGPTGVAEKEITLPIALKLQALLEKEGAKVIMTRTIETFFDNKERILFYRDSTPDLLLSIHLNSSADPIHISGTSTFYRYDGFKNLSNAIQKRMLELGLKDCGNNGSFNFMLNSPIEYPNALIETIYLSNPEEEMKILDQSFQQRLTEKIVLGLKDFLRGCQ